ncbi:GNAT family N-acetyltransferase [Algoriphagus machipongonensis]|uniref:Acetyltransferase, GNAT family n=1 Tax=Algoriphagus machipongonensis TaxID=388413 RepID=A3HZL4_9BACT|nr:GNAT family N-acetyltransferase [Algoriphagus machipongonensis]EAZ80700.1 acetyltransferase, GNAT family [Algoriphagus machipongonensis]
MKEKPDRFIIKKASLEELYQIHLLIPEFEGEVKIDFYQDRLKDKLHLALVAEVNGELAGFKVGYESDNPEIFYSWMGGVIPKYRKTGVAKGLADYQEKWAQENGFHEVFFKTRNRFTAMVMFGLKRGFHIEEVIQKGDVRDYRILMHKRL